MTVRTEQHGRGLLLRDLSARGPSPTCHARRVTQRALRRPQQLGRDDGGVWSCGPSLLVCSRNAPASDSQRDKPWSRPAHPQTSPVQPSQWTGEEKQHPALSGAGPHTHRRRLPRRRSSGRANSSGVEPSPEQARTPKSAVISTDAPVAGRSTPDRPGACAHSQNPREWRDPVGAPEPHTRPADEGRLRSTCAQAAWAAEARSK